MFSFDWPWVFLAFPLPIIIYSLLPPAAKPTHYLHVPFLAELLKLNAQQSLFTKTTLKRWGFYLVLWLCFLSAAAQPQLNQQPSFLPHSGRDILLAVDLSGSMATEDIELNGEQNTRLSLVKYLFKQLIEQRSADRFGLLYFADQAFLYSPLTLEHETLKRWIDEANVGLVGDQTAIGDAIGLSIKTLRQTHTEKLLLLITDGANTAGVMPPIAAATLAAHEQIRIYTIGVGSLNKAMEATDYNPDLLKKVAALSGGEFFQLKDLASLNQLIQRIDELAPKTHPQALVNSQSLYHWPLSVGLGLFLLFYTRGIWQNVIAQLGFNSNRRRPQ